MRLAAPSLPATGRRTGCSRISRSRPVMLAEVGPAVEGLSRPVRKVLDLLGLGLGLLGESRVRVGVGARVRVGVEVHLLGCGSSKVCASIACNSGTDSATWIVGSLGSYGSGIGDSEGGQHAHPKQWWAAQ